MKTSLSLLFLLITLQLYSQIWDQHHIQFPNPSQAWRIRPAADNAAWTFGYEIDEDFNYLGSELYCQKSNDGGITWQSKQFKSEIGNGGFIADVIGLDSTHAFVSYFDNDNGPILYRTVDGGQNWLTNNAEMDYYLDWVYFYDILNGVAFGDPGDDGFFQISHTTDGGVSWTRIDTLQSLKAIATDEYGFASEFDVSGDMLVTRTWYDRVFYSMDKGLSWMDMATPENASGYINQIELDDNKTIFLCYSDDNTGTFQIFKKGLNETEWREITPDNKEGYISGFNAIPGTSSLIFNAGYFGSPETFTTRVSHDDGNSWLVVAANEGLQYGFVQFANANTGYACEIPRGFELPSTKVFVYNGSPLTGLLSQNILDATVDVYPNPTSEKINIKLTSDKANDYWILISDMKGNLIEKKTTANVLSFEEQFSLASLPAGPYQITVSSKDGSISKSIIKTN